MNRDKGYLAVLCLQGNIGSNKSGKCRYNHYNNLKDTVINTIKAKQKNMIEVTSAYGDHERAKLPKEVWNVKMQK